MRPRGPAAVRYLQCEMVVTPGDGQPQGVQLTGLVCTGGAWPELHAQLRLVDGQKANLQELLQDRELHLQPDR